MTQDERWLKKYNEVVAFIENNKRNLNEYNEWLLNQQRQQEAVQRFLREYYK